MTIKKQMRHVFRCPVVFGKNGTGLQAGYDSVWYGDTEDANFMWDTSANRMIFEGVAGITIDGASTTACIIFTDTAIEALINFGTSSSAIALGSKSSNMYLDMRYLTVEGNAYILGSYHKYETSAAMATGGFYGTYQRAYIKHDIQDIYMVMGKLDFSGGTTAISPGQVCATMSEIDLGGTGTITVATAGGIYGHLVLFDAVEAGDRDIETGPIKGVTVVWLAPKNYSSSTYLYSGNYGDDTTIDYGYHLQGAGALVAGLYIKGEGNGSITKAIEILTADTCTITTGIDIEGSGGGVITTGIDIGDCTTGINVTGATTDAILISGTPTNADIRLHNGATIMNTSSGVLTITEDNVIITGNLQVDGTTTTVNTATITIDDPNIQLGAIGTPTDSNADGGGITLMGDGSPTNKTIIWDNTNDNWTFNQSVNLSSGLVYKIDNVEHLSADTLTFANGATIDNSTADLLTLTEDTIRLVAVGDGKIQFGGPPDWGVGATGARIDGGGWDWVTGTIGNINSGVLATSVAAAYHAMTVNVNQTTSTSVFGTWTELYIKAGVDLGGSDNYAAIWGQVECLGSVTTPDTGNYMAAVYGNFIAPTTFTIADGVAVNGFRAQLEAGTIGTTGTARTAAFECLVTATEWDYGVYLNDYVTGIYFAETGAATEHLIDVVDAYLGLVIETGTYGDTATAVKLTSTNTRPVSFLFDDGGANISGGADVRATLSRIALTVDQSGASIAALRGQCKLTSDTDFDGYHLVGVEGYLELEGSNDLSLPTDGSAAACFRGRIEVTSSMTHATASTYMTAFFADLKCASGVTITNTTGTLAGLVIDASDVDGTPTAPDKWGHGIFIAADATDCGITIGACTNDGILISGAVGDNGVEITGVCSGAAFLTSGASAKAFEASNIVCASGAYGASIITGLDDGASEGSALYLQTNLTGAPTGNCFNFGCWTNINEAYPAGAIKEVRVADFGIYGVGHDVTGYQVAILNIESHFSTANPPDTIAQIRFNCLATGSGGAGVDYLFRSANDEAMCYSANAIHTDADTDKVGAIKIYTPGAGVCYLYVYDHPGQ